VTIAGGGNVAARPSLRVLRLGGPRKLTLGVQIDAPIDREFEFLVRAFEHLDRLAVIHIRKLRADDSLELCNRPFSMRWSKKARSSCLSLSKAAKVYFSSASANTALSERAAKAISGSIIQNSARWRLVFKFSARKVRPNV
jgi:hypothetical protein